MMVRLYKRRLYRYSGRTNLEILMAIATVHPSTGQLIKSFESLSTAEIEAKLQRAAEAFRSYRKTSFAERAQWMLRAAALLEQKKEAYAKVMTTEMGKTFRSAVDEVAKCAWVCRYYAENAERFLADEVVDRKSTRLNSSHRSLSRMPSSA